jgi:hypothetical protein
MIVSTAFSGLPVDQGSVIRRYQHQAPVDVVGMASALGVNVWEDALDPGISGKLIPDQINGGQSGYSIVVNAPEAYVRKRFTVAHELAHFLLHRNAAGAGISDDVYYRSGLSGGMETQANQLAAEILMPFSLINSLFNTGMRDVEGLASALHVSIPAMKIRLGIPLG